MAANGYIDAEPLVCRHREETTQILVVEGNRRLAACLILADDDRAVRWKDLHRRFAAIQKKNNKQSIHMLPAIVFEVHEQEQAVLAYLGVRHIVSSQPWDSYAKAAWVARVVANSSMTVSAISSMIGDHHKTISRMLEGYYFVKQLQEAGKFTPEDSIRKGRGSVTDYPFSWVYTILGYRAVRDYLEIRETENETPQANPVPEKHYARAQLMTRAMFGSKSLGLSSAIQDSRRLADLAGALANPEQEAMLRQGKSLDDVLQAAKSLNEKLNDGMNEVKDILSLLISGLGEGGLKQDIASSLLPLAVKIRNLANRLERDIRETVDAER
ncbi:MAG: hypothetical protein HQL57_02805 [Magnetococcales bacterium]|nr:hypothetical protein [Magnetococcales bacterium]